MIKADSSVLVHSDGGSCSLLNWMSPPCKLASPAAGRCIASWARTDDRDRGDHQRRSLRPGARGLRAWSRTAWSRTSRSCRAAEMQVLGEGWRLVRRAVPDRELLSRPVAAATWPALTSRWRSKDVATSTEWSNSPLADRRCIPAGAGAGHLRGPGDPAAGPGAGAGPRHPVRDAGDDRSMRGTPTMAAPRLSTARLAEQPRIVRRDTKEFAPSRPRLDALDRPSLRTAERTAMTPPPP